MKLGEVRKLRIPADDCVRLGAADAIVPEPLGGAHRDAAGTMRSVSDALAERLAELEPLSGPELREDRYRRFRRLGVLAPVN